jgi:hypothetical protein
VVAKIYWTPLVTIQGNGEMARVQSRRREDYTSTLNVSSQVSRERLIGVKDASGENAEGSIVMNHKRFQLECLTDHVQDIFHFHSTWGGSAISNTGEYWYS